MSGLNKKAQSFQLWAFLLETSKWDFTLYGAQIAQKTKGLS